MASSLSQSSGLRDSFDLPQLLVSSVVVFWVVIELSIRENGEGDEIVDGGGGGECCGGMVVVKELLSDMAVMGVVVVTKFLKGTAEGE